MIKSRFITANSFERVTLSTMHQFLFHAFFFGASRQKKMIKKTGMGGRGKVVHDSEKPSTIAKSHPKTMRKPSENVRKPSENIRKPSENVRKTKKMFFFRVWAGRSTAVQQRPKAIRKRPKAVRKRPKAIQKPSERSSVTPIRTLP